MAGWCQWPPARVDQCTLSPRRASAGRAVDKGYKDKARSMLYNLNNDGNPDLRRAVLTVQSRVFAVLQRQSAYVLFAPTP